MQTMVPAEQNATSKWNVKRGLIRLWAFFSVIWLVSVTADSAIEGYGDVWYVAYAFGVPFAGFALGSGIWWVAIGFKSMAQLGHATTNNAPPRKDVRKVNGKRGMLRVWMFFTAVWLCGLGALGVSLFSKDLQQVGSEMVASITRDPSEADYEALCSKLRKQVAGGGPVDEITLLPRLEVVVTKGVAKAVGTPGRCLAVFAKEEGVELIPVVTKIVGGDGSAIREIEDAAGNRKPFDYRPVPPIRPSVSDADRRGNMYGFFAFVFAVPLTLLVLGWGLWWVAMGFKL
jgi:hypothetical protein